MMAKLTTAVLLLSALIGCSALGPSPEITGTTAREGIPNFDYTVFVECTVRNNGREGDVTVVAQLQGGGFWKKRATVHLLSKSEQKVTIAFPEADLLAAGLSGLQYGCATE